MRASAKPPVTRSPSGKPGHRMSPAPKPYHHGDLRRVLRRFRAEIEAALAGAPAGDPLACFRCLGLPYLRWATRNPTRFEILSSRRFFDHDKAVGVSADNAELIALTERTLAEAFALGQLRSLDLKQVQIAGRALVYGCARMNIDGHFPRWGVDGAEAEQTAEPIIDLFIEGIARRA